MVGCQLGFQQNKARGQGTASILSSPSHCYKLVRIPGQETQCSGGSVILSSQSETQKDSLKAASEVAVFAVLFRRGLLQEPGCSGYVSCMCRSTHVSKFRHHTELGEENTAAEIGRYTQWFGRWETGPPWLSKHRCTNGGLRSTIGPIHRCSCMFLHSQSEVWFECDSDCSGARESHCFFSHRTSILLKLGWADHQSRTQLRLRFQSDLSWKSKGVFHCSRAI